MIMKKPSSWSQSSTSNESLGKPELFIQSQLRDQLMTHRTSGCVEFILPSRPVIPSKRRRITAQICLAFPPLPTALSPDHYRSICAIRGSSLFFFCALCARPAPKPRVSTMDTATLMPYATLKAYGRTPWPRRAPRCDARGLSHFGHSVDVVRQPHAAGALNCTRSPPDQGTAVTVERKVPGPSPGEAPYFYG
jgi:hypothetical protein